MGITDDQKQAEARLLDSSSTVSMEKKQMFIKDELLEKLSENVDFLNKCVERIIKEPTSEELALSLIHISDPTRPTLI